MKIVTLKYQAIVDLNDNVATGYELLSRFHIPFYGDVPPLVLFSLFNRYRLGWLLTIAILNKFISELKVLSTLGGKFISININKNDLKHIRVIRLLTKINDMLPTGFNLQVELVETGHFCNTMEKNLSLLKKRGVIIALDDFGMGFNGAVEVLKIKPDVIKFDRIILDTPCLLSSLFSYYNGVGYKVIVEGVEKKQHIKLLKKMRVRYVQGYYFSMPFNIK